MLISICISPGADIVGVNCNFDPKSSIQTLKLMKDALEQANLHPYLMAQPLGFHCLDSINTVDGYMTLPEYPMGKIYASLIVLCIYFLICDM